MDFPEKQRGIGVEKRYGVVTIADIENPSVMMSPDHRIYSQNVIE